jgi:hypothetical protein
MSRYGIWDKENCEFTRFYDLWCDEEAVAKFMALDKEVWIAGGPEVEALEKAAEEKEGLKLFVYDTCEEAEENLLVLHPYYYADYEVREIPEDEPEWELF